MIKKRWRNTVIGFILALGMLGGCAETLEKKTNSSNIGNRVQFLKNVVITGNGYYKPAPCYNWKYPDNPNNYEVVSLNIYYGIRFRNGGWIPKVGYRWADPFDGDDLCVVKSFWFNEWLLKR